MFIKSFILLLLAFTIVVVNPMTLHGGNSDSELLRAIIQVESGGDVDAVGDGGEAIGILQIHKIMVDDVNRIVGHKMYRYDDRLDPAKSAAMFNAYTRHYSRGASRETIARRWNGGPRGDKKSSTKIYWDRVRRHLK